MLNGTTTSRGVISLVQGVCGDAL